MPRKTKKKSQSGVILFLLLLLGLAVAVYLGLQSADLRQQAFNGKYFRGARPTTVNSYSCTDYVKMASKRDVYVTDADGILGSDGQYYPVSISSGYGIPGNGQQSNATEFDPGLSQSFLISGVERSYSRILSDLVSYPSTVAGEYFLYVGQNNEIIRSLQYNPLTNTTVSAVDFIVYPGEPGYGPALASALTTDLSGNIYVLWTENAGIGVYKVSLTKFNQSGILQPGYPVDLYASTQVPGKLQNVISMMYNPVVNKLYVTDNQFIAGGGVHRLQVFGTDGSYNPADNVNWSTKTYTPAARLAVDGLGNVYVSGRYLYDGQYVVEINKYTADGATLLNTITGNTPEVPGADGQVGPKFLFTIKGFSVDAEGSLYLAHTDYDSGERFRITKYGCPGEQTATPTPTPALNACQCVQGNVTQQCSRGTAVCTGKSSCTCRSGFTE